MDFDSDDEALDVLNGYGHSEQGNGILKAHWDALNDECKAAVQYLCDEWDFCFEDVPIKSGVEYVTLSEAPHE